MTFLTFLNPIWLLLLILIPILYYFYLKSSKKRKRAAIKFSNIGLIKVAQKNKVVLIPNPVPYRNNNVRIDLIEQEVKSIRSEFKLDISNVVCLTLSGARQIKGHDNMLKGFKSAYIKNRKLRLFIAAHGERTEHLKLLVKQLGLEDVVNFIGFISGARKEAFLNVSDIYVNTAYFEPFGLVYLESIIYKMANIASNKGGGRDIFCHKKNAYLVDPYSVEIISDAFTYLSNSNKRNKLIENSQSLLPNYKLNVIVEKYLEIYSRATD